MILWFRISVLFLLASPKRNTLWPYLLLILMPTFKLYVKVIQIICIWIIRLEWTCTLKSAQIEVRTNINFRYQVDYTISISLSTVSKNPSKLSSMLICLTMRPLGWLFKSAVQTNYLIKSIDRLLGNPRLHHERQAVYQWYAWWLLTDHLMLTKTILVQFFPYFQL